MTRDAELGRSLNRSKTGDRDSVLSQKDFFSCLDSLDEFDELI
ncbi:MAG: hypothetical protein WCA35_11285 [Kovacikia sp.]